MCIRVCVCRRVHSGEGRGSAFSHHGTLHFNEIGNSEAKVESEKEGKTAEEATHTHTRDQTREKKQKMRNTEMTEERREEENHETVSVRRERTHVYSNEME